MKKLSFLIATLLTGMSVVSCFDSGSGYPDRFTGSLLWKISGNGLDAPSYILGTHHWCGEDTFDAIPGARAALVGARQVVGEVVMGDLADMTPQMQQAAKMPEGESYRTLLSKSDYTALDKGLKSLVGTGMDQFSAYKPELISALFMAPFYTKMFPEINFATLVPIDFMVQNFATEKGLPVVGLETLEEQLHSMLDAEPLRVQAESLVCEVCNVRYVRYAVAAIRRQIRNYVAGDLAAMYRNGFHDPKNPCPLSVSEKNAMLKERNDRWLERLPAIMSAAPSFIAVGALHLAGEEGLLFQLERMGYTVEAVK